MTLTACPSQYVALAHRLADAGGEVIRRYFRASFEVEGKLDASPVTVADRETEQAMRGILHEACPEHGISGEEFGETHMDAEWVWALDPIDGTRAFVSGKPVFGSLIALLHRGVPVLGVIDQPILRERWIGGLGVPTMFNGKPCRTRSCLSLHNAVSVLSPNAFLDEDDEYLAPYRIMNKRSGTVSVGGDCYAYGLLASGFCDVICEGKLKLHDYAALAPVVEAAGGLMTDWRGEKLGIGSAGDVIAAGDKRAWEEAVKILGQA